MNTMYAVNSLDRIILGSAGWPPT